MQVFGVINDAEASYSYHDYALVRLHGEWYLLETAGCSCPSPSETWGVTRGPTTLGDIRRFIQEEGGERGWGVTKRQNAEFVALVDDAEKATA